MILPERLAALDVCHLTTQGRLTGRPHTIEIWFAHRAGTLYFLAGGARRSDWVRNLLRTPAVTVRLDGRAHPGRARLVGDGAEQRLARDLVFAKYQPGYAGDLAQWRERALPVAVDLDPATAD